MIFEFYFPDSKSARNIHKREVRKKADVTKLLTPAPLNGTTEITDWERNKIIGATGWG